MNLSDGVDALPTFLTKQLKSSSRGLLPGHINKSSIIKSGNPSFANTG